MNNVLSPSLTSSHKRPGSSQNQLPTSRNQSKISENQFPKLVKRAEKLESILFMPDIHLSLKSFSQESIEVNAELKKLQIILPIRLSQPGSESSDSPLLPEPISSPDVFPPAEPFPDWRLAEKKRCYRD